MKLSTSKGCWYYIILQLHHLRKSETLTRLNNDIGTEINDKKNVIMILSLFQSSIAYISKLECTSSVCRWCQWVFSGVDPGHIPYIARLMSFCHCCLLCLCHHFFSWLVYNSINTVIYSSESRPHAKQWRHFQLITTCKLLLVARNIHEFGKALIFIYHQAYVHWFECRMCLVLP